MSAAQISLIAAAGLGFAWAAIAVRSWRGVGALLIGGAGALVGARAVHLLLHPGAPPSGWGLDGGLLGLAAGLLAGGVLLKADLPRLLWSATPGAALGIAVMRVGCRLTGCCFGRPTGGEWGIACAPEDKAGIHQMLHGGLSVLEAPHPIHPAQMYELAGAVFAGAAALVWAKKADRPGLAFWAFLLMIAAVRLANLMLFRAEDFSAAVNPVWVTAALALAGAAGLWGTANRKNASSC